MSFGFSKMVYTLSGHLVPVAQLAREAGFGDEMVARLHDGGLRRVPVADTPSCVALVRQALDQLFSDDTQRRHICGVIFAHSVPVLAPDGVPFLNLCLEGYGLEGVPRVAVAGQPCSILHMAIQLARHWLPGSGEGGQILLVSGDQAYSVQDRIFFGSAMGDAATASLIERDTASHRILASVSHTEVMAFEGEKSPPEAIAAFRKVNPSYIREAIERCLSQAGLTLEAVDIIIPHTPYLGIWDVIATLLRYPRERILTDYLNETGHLNSNDVFVHYVRAVQEGRIQPGQHAMWVSPGFGGTRGCTLLRY